MDEFENLAPDDTMSDEDAWGIFEAIRDGGFRLQRFDLISLSRLFGGHLGEDLPRRPGLTDKEIVLAARLKREFLT